MRLHEQVKHQQNLIATLEDGLLDLRRYCNSEKFSIDVMINKNDILLRLNETQQALDSLHNSV